MIEKQYQFNYQITLSNVWLPRKYDFFFLSDIPLISQQPNRFFNQLAKFLNFGG